MIGRRLQTGSFAYGAVHIGGQTAAAADNVVVVVAHPRFVAGRMARGLDTAYKARFRQDAQIVVDRLRGERAEPLTGSVRNGFRIPMLSLAQNGGEYG